MSDITPSAPSALPTDPAMLALLKAGQARRSRNRAAAAKAANPTPPASAEILSAAPEALAETPPLSILPLSPYADSEAASYPEPTVQSEPRAKGAAPASQFEAEPIFAALAEALEKATRSESAESIAPSPLVDAQSAQNQGISLAPKITESAQQALVEAVNPVEIKEPAPAAPAEASAEPSVFVQNAGSPRSIAINTDRPVDLSPEPDAVRAVAPLSALDRLAAARQLIKSTGLQTAFAGPRAPEQRSIWRHVRWAAGATALVATLAVAAFVHHSAPAGHDSVAKSAPAWSHAGALATAQAGTPAKATAIAARGKNFLAPVGYGSAVIPQPVAPALLALPIPIDDANPLSEHELAVALLPKDPFLALAVTVERLRTRSYYDVAGANIGMGYCVPMRLAVYGKARVTQDFEQAGMSREQISNMLSGNRKKVLSVEITQSEALRLLMITKSDYVELARNVAGAKAFASMSLERQTALTYLAYNSNIGQFSQLASALARGHDLEAMGEMVPSFRMSADAPLQKNYRLGSYLWAAWTGTLSDAIGNPMRHEGLYANENGLSSFQRAYGLTKKVGAKAKAKFAAPVSSVQATTNSAVPQATLAGVGAPAQATILVANVIAKAAPAKPIGAVNDASMPSPAQAAAQEKPQTKTTPSPATASAPMATTAADSVSHPAAHDALPKSLASSPALPRAKLVAPPALSSEQARALRVRLANRRQTVAAPTQPISSALPQANASATARARLLEQADQNLESAPSRPGM